MTQPTTLAYPLINGVRHSFASIELKLAGQLFVGFKSINYSRKRTRAMARGNSPDPIGKTKGDNEYTGDCEMYLAEWNLFQSILQKQTGIATGYGDVFFQVLVTYSENGFDTIQDVLNGCTADSTEASQSQGPDALVRKVELNPLKILFNGIDDLLTPLGPPPGS